MYVKPGQGQVTALFEINELIEIHRRLAGTYDVHLIRHVQTVSRGPINYVDENPATSSNAARNIAFELAVMAKLASVGIPLDFSIPIDVACDFGGRSLLFECKRPQSTEKVETNVRKAFAQLEEKYRTSQRYRHRGIIALDVTKLINPEFMLYSQADEVGLSEGLGHLVDDIVRTHERLWQRGRDPKTIGVMIRACVMGVNQARDHMLTYCQQWGLTAIGHVGAQSIGTVIALTNALRGTSENVV
jgi:hypothetical protein